MTDLIIENVRLIDPASGLDQHGALLVRDGHIADFGPGIGRLEGAQVIDGDGAVLCPGLVDMRAEVGEPGGEYRETIASAAIAAAAGGITTLAALPDTKPAIDDPALVRHLRARGRDVHEQGLLAPRVSGEHALRREHVQRRASVLQRELRALHRAGGDVLPGCVRGAVDPRQRAVRDEHVQRRASVLQRELRSLRGPRRVVLAGAVRVSTRARRVATA